MDTQEFSLRDTEVAFEVPESFFPTEMDSPDLGCSSLGANSTFSLLDPERPLYKRHKSAEDEEVEQLTNLRQELQRLRGVNHLLQSSCNCIQNKATAAVCDQDRLLMLVKALQPHKQSFQLHPLQSQRSSVGSNQGFLQSLYEEDPAEKFLAFEHSPSKSQPGPCDSAMTPCKDDKRRVQSARPSGQPSNAKSPRLPVKLEEDPRSAHAAAVAAAALAVNGGNPAAALLDLLHMAMNRKREGQ